LSNTLIGDYIISSTAQDPTTSKAILPINLEMDYKQSFETPTNDEVQMGEIESTTNGSAFKRWLRTLSVETGGIERVTDEDRAKNTSKVWNACTFWWVNRPTAADDSLLFKHVEWNKTNDYQDERQHGRRNLEYRYGRR
jgi:hypothetical protein